MAGERKPRLREGEPRNGGREKTAAKRGGTSQWPERAARLDQRQGEVQRADGGD